MRVMFFETRESWYRTTIGTVGEVGRHARTSRTAALEALGVAADPRTTRELWAAYKVTRPDPIPDPEER